VRESERWIEREREISLCVRERMSLRERETDRQTDKQRATESESE
jgi:hypothetical protein